jgi:hypothetical protein
VPERFASVTTIGPVRLADIPLSAIDYHVSDVLHHLMAIPEVRMAEAGLGLLGGPPSSSGERVQGLLKSAMWIFRSGLNNRRWLCLEGEAIRSLVQNELDEEAEEKGALSGLWTSALSAADAYSKAYIRGKFR